jgi:hypothetical protein
MLAVISLMLMYYVSTFVVGTANKHYRCYNAQSNNFFVRAVKTLPYIEVCYLSTF